MTHADWIGHWIDEACDSDPGEAGEPRAPEGSWCPALLLGFYRGDVTRDEVRNGLLRFAEARDKNAYRWLRDNIQAIDFSGLDRCPLWGAALLLECHGRDVREALGQARRNVDKYHSLASTYSRSGLPIQLQEARDKARDWNATRAVLKAAAGLGWAGR